ncbi:hypothetical protein E7744_15480 (plasmid) [Citricoccus sp. SGAir0253]|nr:hypothetical protein E7744_15480 [Citricoccus sp. SGAir0253]
MYVYFWRWAIWKAFQQDPQEKAVVSFITASSWLDGPAFLGLRKLAVETASEIWVMDLGGEGRGARKEDNVFDIQSPVAIVTLVKSGKASRTAKIFYRRFRGSRQEKFDQLDKIDRLDPTDGWTEFDAPNGERFIPVATDNQWSAMPSLVDLFPWQQPGIKYNRTWPVAPSRDVLKRRWTELLVDESADTRAEKFVDGHSGRDIHTKVGSLPPLAELPAGATAQTIVRMGWRSFDQQWTFDDPRLANLERPALWQGLSDQQIFLVSPWTARISNGPAATVSVGIPDLHYFRGSFGGKDVIPLYRDAECSQANITAGLLAKLAEALGDPISPEDLLAYCYAVLAHPGYTETFHDQLENDPVHVPITNDPQLFSRAVDLGRELLWLQTFGTRFTTEDRPHGRVPRRDGLVWLEPVTAIPEDMKAVQYDANAHQLHVGDGVVGGVIPAVRHFEVSGMNVLDKWLGARTRKGIGKAAGKAAKPLDRIRPTEWEDEWNDELLDLLRVLTATVDKYADQADLLVQVLSGPLIAASDLPAPSAAERKVPKTIKRDSSPVDLTEHPRLID